MPSRDATALKRVGEQNLGQSFGRAIVFEQKRQPHHRPRQQRGQYPKQPVTKGGFPSQTRDGQNSFHSVEKKDRSFRIIFHSAWPTTKTAFRWPCSNPPPAPVPARQPPPATARRAGPAIAAWPHRPSPPAWVPRWVPRTVAPRTPSTAPRLSPMAARPPRSPRKYGATRLPEVAPEVSVELSLALRTTSRK